VAQLWLGDRRERFDAGRHGHSCRSTGGGGAVSHAILLA
jgi:hypothetical protein